jgi:hypothetical protein
MRFRLDQPVVGPGVPLTDAQWARIERLLPDRTPVTEESFAAFAGSGCSNGIWSQSDVRMWPVRESSRRKRVPSW